MIIGVVVSMDLVISSFSLVLCLEWKVVRYCCSMNCFGDVIVRIGYMYEFQYVRNVVIFIMMNGGLDSGRKMCMKMFYCLQLLSIVVFLRFFGMLRQNWWMKNIMVVFVSFGMMSIVRVLSIDS